MKYDARTFKRRPRNYDPECPPNYYDTREYRQMTNLVAKIIVESPEPLNVVTIQQTVLGNERVSESLRRNLPHFIRDVMANLIGAGVIEEFGSVLCPQFRVRAVKPAPKKKRERVQITVNGERYVPRPNLGVERKVLA